MQELTQVGDIPVTFSKEVHSTAGATFGRQQLYVARATVKGREFLNYGATKKEAAAGLAEWIRDAGYTGTLKLGKDQ